ncbi:EamA family transporter [Cryobacterium tagatosivorans]|uniref:EamA/RhaT family transporter n=1 Tax=Cryobacterium tagatosivorans TaxID=1259199 RepID=A0A4R8UFD2_9MICO|nr:EamA family transporter [Cryobacterium tagatosivorans]TFB51772.1 EamA/RhaT family transporter [Cryobacterium tagatosivorans]
MLTAVYGLTGALIFGAADFLGGLASKRISAMLATAVAALTGLVGLLLVFPVVGGAWSVEAVIWGALSGVSGAIAISLLYACLAVGPMSILSPLTAVVSAVVPATVGLLGGDRLAPIGYWALGLALVAVVLVGFVPERGAVRPTLRGIVMAVGSGIMIGAFLIMIDLTPDDSGLVPLVLNRTVNGAIMLTVVGIIALAARRRRRWTPAPPRSPAESSTLRAGLALAAACGIVDAVANFLLLLGVRAGDLSVMSVLTAMYPTGTILLAAVVLRERIAPVQWVGLVLALAAAAMLAIA